MNHAPMKRVFHVAGRRSAVPIPQSACVLVSFSVNSSCGNAIHASTGTRPVRLRRSRSGMPSSTASAEHGLLAMPSPGPLIAEPQRRQHMQRCGVRPAIGDRDADQNVVRVGLGVFDEDVEIAVLGRRRRCRSAQTRDRCASAPLVLVEQARVGKLSLRILVQALHVGVRGRGIQVVVALLDIFAVIALVAAQAEEALFEDGIAPIPERERETQALMVVADAGDAVLAPAVGAQVRVLEREIFPGACRRRCSLRGRCPRRARKDRDPSAASAAPAGRRRSGDVARRS